GEGAVGEGKGAGGSGHRLAVHEEGKEGLGKTVATLVGLEEGRSGGQVVHELSSKKCHRIICDLGRQMIPQKNQCGQEKARAPFCRGRKKCGESHLRTNATAPAPPATRMPPTADWRQNSVTLGLKNP